MNDRLLVAILAAGASRRLGRPKQFIEIDGEPLVRRQSRMAIDAGIGPVILVLGCLGEQCADVVSELGISVRGAGDAHDAPYFSVYQNECWQEGVASSIRCAAQFAMQWQMAGLLILHADQYRITSNDLRSLHAAWLELGAFKAIRSQDGEHAGPPAIFPRSLFPACLQLEGDSGAGGIFAELPAGGKTEFPLPAAAFDIDEPSHVPNGLSGTCILRTDC